MDWFDNLFPEQRKYLAKTYLLLTTQDTNDFALAQEEALLKFRSIVLKQDFPLRQLSKIVFVRSIVDFILQNRELLTGKSGILTGMQGTESKVVDLTEKHWEKVIQSWQDLRRTELTDRALHVWLKKLTQAI